MSTAVIMFILTILAVLFAFVSYITHLRYKGYMRGTLHRPTSESREKRMSMLLCISYSTGILFYICLVMLLIFIPSWKTVFHCLLILCAVFAMSIAGYQIYEKPKSSKHEIIMCEGKNCLLKKKCYRYFAFEHRLSDNSESMSFCPIENRPGYVHFEEVKGGEE